jgi:hypothetical protein
MIKVLQEPALAKQMVQGSRRDLDDITWDYAADMVYNLYKELA